MAVQDNAAAGVGAEQGPGGDGGAGPLDLNRRRPKGERVDPASGREAVQIDQDVDPGLADALGRPPGSHFADDLETADPVPDLGLHEVAGRLGGREADEFQAPPVIAA